jgi:hypothetical protein
MTSVMLDATRYWPIAEIASRTGFADADLCEWLGENAIPTQEIAGQTHVRCVYAGVLSASLRH